MREIGGRAVALRGDVTREDDVVGMFVSAENALGPITDVVVNAGVAAPASKLADMSLERMRNVFEVNTLGAYLTAREAARRMMKSRGGQGGSIVFVSSAAARLGSPNLYVDYAGSKGALDTLTRGLSIELGPEGVRVNCVRPGLIETEMHASGGEPDRAITLGAGTPIGRAGLVEEVAEAIAFLLDDDGGVLHHRRDSRRYRRTLIRGTQWKAGWTKMMMVTRRPRKKAALRSG